MALKDIFDTLNNEGEKERDRILKAARQEAGKMIRLAEEDAEKVKENELHRASLSLKGETARIINQAKLFKKEEAIKAKEQFIDESFENARLKTADLRQTKDYERIFESLAREALERVDGHVVASVDKRDEVLAKRIFAKLSDGIEIRADISCSGGVSIGAADGRITYDNTIDSRLEKARTVLKSRVAEALFSS